MMAEFRWIVMSSFLMLVLQFAAATEKCSLVGENVTLSCKTDQDSCDGTTWLLSRSGRNTVTLFEHGKIHKDVEAKADRLRVTKSCSLVIKNITDEDAGRYICRQFIKSGQQVGEDTVVDLSVVNITELKDRDRVALQCSVSTYLQCRHKVRWLYEGNQNDVRTPQRTCAATVRFRASDRDQKSKKYQLLKCEVRDASSKEVHLFTFSPPQPSGGGAAATTKTTTTTTATNTVKPTLTTINEWTSTLEGTIQTTSQNNNNQRNKGGWWRYIVAAVVVSVSALLIIVAVIRWKRTKENNTQMGEDMAHPEDGVSYASIRYGRRTNGEAQVQVSEDAVTYSTLRVSSSLAEAPADHSCYYATVNKPKK